MSAIIEETSKVYKVILQPNRAKLDPKILNA